MRNPYIVGSWLYGENHYGRQRLLEYLINVHDPAVWVIGTRRMGKTSLLRQLEWLTDRPESQLVPLFWDIQGCETADDFSYELFVSVEDKAERFESLGVNVAALQEMDLLRILRTLHRDLRAAGKQLFLLVDETEAFINLAKHDDQLLARLRKVFQSGNQRTVMVATKLLMQLNDLSKNWLTSPFLFGVSLVNLWSLDHDAGRALILQNQNSHQLEVSSPLVEEILVHTHRHPYLLQYLCQRLFEPLDATRGTLRAITEDDLSPDHQLAGFFQIDFTHLAPLERQILLAVARQGVLTDEKLFAELEVESPRRIAMFVYGMNKLGYLRQVYGQWILGNEFLRRWVIENHDRLAQDVESQVSDQTVESLLTVGRSIERSYIRQEMHDLQSKLDALIVQRSGYGTEVPLALSNQIQDLRRAITSLGEQLRQLDDNHIRPA